MYIYIKKNSLPLLFYTQQMHRALKKKNLLPLTFCFDRNSTLLLFAEIIYVCLVNNSFSLYHKK